jgi:hypothetical protein
MELSFGLALYTEVSGNCLKGPFLRMSLQAKSILTFYVRPSVIGNIKTLLTNRLYEVFNIGLPGFSDVTSHDELIASARNFDGECYIKGL